MDLINMIGASATILMGCLGLFFPNRASAFTGLTASTVEARAEFRGTLGITFILLGLFPLLTQSPYAFATVGLCWAGAALGRVVSIFVDRAQTPKNWAGVVFETMFATLLLMGQPFIQVWDSLIA
jgi:hypothetical protein